MKFAYERHNDSNEIVRVEVKDEAPFVARDDWHQVDFQTWWNFAVSDDTKAAWTEGAEDGTLNDPDFGVLDALTGEPI